MTRHIAFLIYRDFQLLDAAGPIAAFEVAARYRPGAYTLRVIAAEPGTVASSSGACLQAGPLGRARGIDTLVVAGGEGSRSAMACLKTRRYIQACALRARRTASVCSGSYLLAAAGLLDGRRATTHWSRAADFARKFPLVRVDPDCIFVKDGSVWTSAGITAGIDLSLALIEDDLGETIARRVAQQLVVYYRRPGGQSQFSALLEMERANGRFAALLDHVRSHLEKRHSVADLAEQACMSPRNFSRAFFAETGMTPAKAIEQLRAETARGSLAGNHRSVQDIARACGYGNPERMRRSFLRLFGAPPSAMKYHGRPRSRREFEASCATTAATATPEARHFSDPRPTARQPGGRARRPRLAIGSWIDEDEPPPVRPVRAPAPGTR
ncbi:MAG: GlxA family transcriptional regulator [Steroidobacteraceae bacterium]